MGCLYKLTSPSGKCYLGITKGTAAVRFTAHVYNAIHDGYKTALHASIRKYGKEAMHVQTLVIADGWEYLCYLEKRAIIAFDTRWPNGYNITKGGDGFTGTHSEASNKKRSDSLKQNYASGNRKVRIWKPTAEQIEKQASKLRGVKKPPRTAEHSAKISAAKKGKLPTVKQLECLKKGWVLATTEWKGEEMRRRANVRYSKQTKEVPNGN